MVIIGPGYRPAAQNQLLSDIGTLNVIAATDGVSDNVVLLGLNIGSLRPHNNGPCSFGFATKVRLQRCVLSSISPLGVASGTNDSELFAEQCIFISSITLTSACGGPSISTALFNNCIMMGTFDYNTPASNGLVSNCVFFGGSANLATIQNTIFSNNIFYGSQLAAANGVKTGCTFNSNLTFGTNNNALTYPNSSTTGTLANSDPLFVKASPPANGQNYSTLFNGVQNLNLQAGSPAINAGSDGTNLGTSGGSSAFNYFTQGFTPSPVMTSLLINNATLPENGTLQVEFGVEVKE